MPRIGSGITTDNTETSNELYFAGEIINYVYENRDGAKSSSPAVDVTGYTVKESYHAMELTVPGDLSTAIKRTGTGFNTHTVTTAIGSEGVSGDVGVTIPSDILKLVGYDSAPTIGFPHYIAYEVKLSKGTEVYDILESDIIGFRFSLSFDITA